MKELWKPVEGYDGWYEVSNTGKVRSVDRTIVLQGARAGQVRKYRGRELQPMRVQDHLMVHLQRQGTRLNIGLGRLVALHFLEGFKESGKLYVWHKDGDFTNCSVDNLYFDRKTTSNKGAK